MASPSLCLAQDDGKHKSQECASKWVIWAKVGKVMDINGHPIFADRGHQMVHSCIWLMCSEQLVAAILAPASKDLRLDHCSSASGWSKQCLRIFGRLG